MVLKPESRVTARNDDVLTPGWGSKYVTLLSPASFSTLNSFFVFFMELVRLFASAL